MEHLDVVVVGAGTAGATVAARLAERGLRTLCIDRGPLDRAGAQWVNGVAAQAFVDAGVPMPEGAELRGKGHRFHLVAGFGPQRVTLDDHGVLDVDMRLLVARLQAWARSAGATLRANVHVSSFDGSTLETSDGPLSARWFIDASGLTGVNLLGSPAVAREDICVAAQGVYAVRDQAAAEAYFTNRGAHPGETLCFTCVAGGYSIINVRLDGGELSILAGSIPALGHPSGQTMLATFLDQNPFIGERRFGGARAIPLARPHSRIVKGHAIAIGDAAGQVFAAHGSGIGLGMIAARMLADALAAGDPAAYEREWHRRYGGLLTAYDLFRRFSQAMTSDDLVRMMRVGLLDAASANAAMSQRFPGLGTAQLVARARSLASAPDFARKIVPVLARMGAARAFYPTCPTNPRARALWDRIEAAL